MIGPDWRESIEQTLGCKFLSGSSVSLNWLESLDFCMISFILEADTGVFCAF